MVGARAQRDNVIVSLPLHYETADLESLMWIARAAIYTVMGCLAVNAVSFLGGFSTFDTSLSLFRARARARRRPVRSAPQPRAERMLHARGARRPACARPQT